MDPKRKDYLATEAVYTGDSLRIGDDYVMHEWERPLIRRMVEDLKLTPDDRLLEIGFGMGISASILQEFGPASHTIVEPHPQVLAQAERWKGARPSIQLHPGYWQQLDPETQRYSAIFFDPFADDQALRQFAGYYSRLPKDSLGAAVPQAHEQGKRLYAQHCSSCHEKQTYTPYVKGQNAQYMQGVLKDMDTGQRTMPEEMAIAMSALKGEELQQLLDYLQGCTREALC